MKGRGRAERRLSRWRQVFAEAPVQNPLEGCRKTAAKKRGSFNYEPFRDQSQSPVS